MRIGSRHTSHPVTWLIMGSVIATGPSSLHATGVSHRPSSQGLSLCPLSRRVLLVAGSDDVEVVSHAHGRQARCNPSCMVVLRLNEDARTAVAIAPEVGS